MSLSAGSLASLCNSRLSRETHPSTLLSSFNLPLDNYLRPESRLSPSVSLLSAPILNVSSTLHRLPLHRDRLRRAIVGHFEGSKDEE